MTLQALWGAPRVSAPLPTGTAMVRMPSAISRTCRIALPSDPGAWRTSTNPCHMSFEASHMTALRQ